jgi:hypothetical protein
METEMLTSYIGYRMQHGARVPTLIHVESGAWTYLSAGEVANFADLLADGEFDAFNEAATDILVTDGALVENLHGEWVSRETAEEEECEAREWLDHYRMEARP